MQLQASQFQELANIEQERTEILRTQGQAQLDFFNQIQSEQQRIQSIAEARSQRAVVRAQEQQRGLFDLVGSNTMRSQAQQRAEAIRRRTRSQTSVQRY